MNDDAKRESAESLVGIAAWSGFDIDKAQLAYWHRKGLLPAPDIARLGKGHGTESVYPAGTSEQLLVLCDIYQEHKRTADIGWRLWLRGYPISDARIRGYVSTHARRFDRLRGSTDEDPDDIVNASETRRLPTTGLGMIRRHVGPKRFPTAVRVLLEVGVGDFNGFEDAGEAAILEKALGSPALGGNIGEALSLVSRLLRTPLNSSVVNATDDDLAEARKEFTSVFGMLRTFGAAAGSILGAQGFTLRLVSKTLRSLRPRDEAVVFALWLAMRTEPEVKAGYDELVGDTTVAWDLAYQASLIIEELRRHVPELADVLSPERMRRGIRDEAHRTAWSAEITAMRRDNMQAIDAFFSARPDARAVLDSIEPPTP